MVWAVINEDIKNAISEFADSPSDRVCAIVGAAIVEEALRRALESRLLVGGIRDRFFKPNRATGSFAVKIDLGYLLGMYDDKAFQALEAMAAVRNEFAHRLPIQSFDDAALQANLVKLTLHTAYQRYPHPLHDGDCAFRLIATTCSD